MYTRLALAISGTLLVANAAMAAPDEASLRTTANHLFEAIPSVEEVIQERGLSDEQIELGRWLFFEPRLSTSHILTCNTCHSLGTGGADNIPTSIGHGWQAGPRNSPTVFNAVFNAAQMWDGRATDLADQARGPIEAAVEMNSTPEHVVATLKSIPGYVELFGQAFPNDGDPVTYDNTLVALQAFEKTLVTPNSRFDQFLAGESSLDEQELQGLDLFLTKGCVACHSGVNLGGQSYFPFGVVERPGADILPPEDKGRFAITETATDEYVFRASPLRNIELTAPYFHSGQVWDLEQSVAIMGTSQLGQELSDDEVKAITEFLRSLTGEQPMIEYPILPPSTRDTPKPDAM